jgi:outer membrane biosynthesis protein TonB
MKFPTKQQVKDWFQRQRASWLNWKQLNPIALLLHVLHLVLLVRHIPLPARPSWVRWPGRPSRRSVKFLLMCLIVALSTALLLVTFGRIMQRAEQGDQVAQTDDDSKKEEPKKEEPKKEEPKKEEPKKEEPKKEEPKKEEPKKEEPKKEEPKKEEPKKEPKKEEPKYDFTKSADRVKAMIEMAEEQIADPKLLTKFKLTRLPPGTTTADINQVYDRYKNSDWRMARGDGGEEGSPYYLQFTYLKGIRRK